MKNLSKIFKNVIGISLIALFSTSATLAVAKKSSAKPATVVSKSSSSKKTLSKPKSASAQQKKNMAKPTTEKLANKTPTAKPLPAVCQKMLNEMNHFVQEAEKQPSAAQRVQTLKGSLVKTQNNLQKLDSEMQVKSCERSLEGLNQIKDSAN